jgi:ribosomal protein S18 acetylase RimI-like enzyme
MSEISRSELALQHVRKMAEKHVRPMAPQDLPVVVDIHMAAFPGYFMTSLGPDFLTIFYTEAQRSSSGISYVFERDGRVLGFCIGSLSEGRFYRELFSKRWFLLAVYSLKAVVKRPLILGRIVGSLFERVSRRSHRGMAVLGTAAVFPEEEARGYGLAIVSACVDHLKKLGVKEVHCEVSKENQGLIRAYRTMGFEVLGERHLSAATALVELCCRIP